MQLARLRSFVAAVELGSLNAAASQLSYTAPAISQHISGLEDELGCELLIRNPTGVTPTDAGRTLYDHARRIVDQVEVARREVSEVAGALPRLRVGSFPTATRHILPDVLVEVRNLCTDVELSLFDFEPPGGIEEVAAGRLDVLVTNHYPGMPEPPAGFESMIDDRLMLVGCPSGGAEVDLAQLGRETWISGPPGLSNRVALETAASAAGFVPQVGFETNEYDVTVTLARRGFGMALVPQLVLAALPEPVAASELIVDGAPLARRIGIVSRQPIRSREIEIFVGAVRDAAASIAAG